MADTVKRFFGGRSREQKWAQIEAQRAQKRSQRDADEEAQKVKAEASASGRRLRAGGRRMLSFQGAETGLATSLGG